MKIGCCSDDTDDHIRIENAGFDYIELSVDVLAAEEPEEEYEPIRDEILSWDIKPEVWYGFVPKNIPVVGKEVDSYRLEKLTRTICKRIEELGGEVLVFNMRPLPEGFSAKEAFDQTVEFLSLAGKISSAYGITIAVEPTYTGEHSTIAEGLQMVRAVDNPFVKLLADTPDVSEKSKMIADIANGGEDIAHVHICDFVSNETDRNELLEKLTDVGYDDRISIQCDWKDFDTEAPAAVELFRNFADAEVSHDVNSSS